MNPTGEIFSASWILVNWQRTDDLLAESDLVTQWRGGREKICKHGRLHSTGNPKPQHLPIKGADGVLITFAKCRSPYSWRPIMLSAPVRSGDPP